MDEFVHPFDKPAYFEQALFLYTQYSKFLDDDYAQNGSSVYDYFLTLILKTLFFVIVEKKKVVGFVYLDNMVGDDERLHSAELTTCFDKSVWGDYTKTCAKTFIADCFERFKLKKIKALVYPENFRVKTLLKSVGFEKEALLKAETLRNNKLQDIEIYSVLNPILSSLTKKEV